MDQTIISNKTWVAVCCFVLLFFIYSTFVTFNSKDPKITVCNEASGATAVIRNVQREYIVVANGSVKDILACIGRGLPFFERKISYLHVGSEIKHKAISNRYTVSSFTQGAELEKYNIEKISNNIYKLSYNNTNTLLVLKKIDSPFVFEEIVSKSKLKSIYMPENSSVVRSLLMKMIVDVDIKIYELKSGEYIGNMLI